MRVLHEANVVEDERGSREYAEPLFLSELTRGSWWQGTIVVSGGQHLLDGGGDCRMNKYHLLDQA